MNRRTLLACGTSAFAVAGLIFAAIPFMESLVPRAGAGAQLPRYRVSDLAPGTIATFDNVWRDSYGERYLLAKFQDGTFDVFSLPLKEGAVGLPDIRWLRIASWCRNFGLQSPAEPVTPSSVVGCNDAGIARASPEWRWTLSGKNLGQYTEDLERPHFVMQHDEIVIRPFP